MINGEYSSGPIDSIIIDRGSRVRREVVPADVAELAASIAARGLIHAPVVRRDMVLVAGETRLLACKSLGWDRITWQWADTVDPDELRLIELEENIKRRDLPWQDKVRAMQAFHEAKLSQDPTWTVAKTAKEIGVVGQSVIDNINIAKALETDPLVQKAERYTVARNMVARKNERAAADQMQIANSVMPPVDAILHADFLEWAPKYSGAKFNFIHCDFPYGINRDKSAQGRGITAEAGGYADTAGIYWDLVQRLCVIETYQSIIAESAHMIFWFSMNYYKETLMCLQGSEWTVDPHPLIWHKSDNQGLLPDPQRGTRRVYETAFFCYRGDRKVIQSVSNLFACPTSQVEGHVSIKPEPMLSHFFRMIVDENTYMLDPTAGSGSAIRACETAGGRALGLELNKDFARRANFAIGQARESRRIK